MGNPSRLSVRSHLAGYRTPSRSGISSSHGQQNMAAHRSRCSSIVQFHPFFLSDFWMLEGNCIPWMNTLYWLDRLFGHGGLDVSIHDDPWWPGRKSKLSAFKAGMPGTYQEVGGVIAGVVGPPFVPRRFLETRKVCGGPNSGLWLVMVHRPGHSIDYHALATLGGLPLQARRRHTGRPAGGPGTG